ncbi:HNH endonuclease [Streptomyces sp. LN590]|uniref:HNH endonuclease n=1 Tax=Streptomyces sp. LN590 TaxID=3112980 RepID=UPI0037161F8A
MARIRTVKPEFWEDEVVGLMPRDARLLFVATFNMADDEGLLRWTPAYIKASAFMYDDDLSVPDVAKLMQYVTDAGLLYPYIGGVARQQMAVIVNFRKHQKINRPQKSKLPPPSLQNGEVRRMYARRDNWTCQLCGGGIPEQPVQNDSHNLSIDHINHQSAGGTDHPSNVRAAHQGCNKGRKDREDDEFVPPRSLGGLNDSLSNSLNGSVSAHAPGMRDDSEVNPSRNASTQSDIRSLNDSVNGSLTSSLAEGKGREGNREGNGTGKGTPSPPPAASTSDDPGPAFDEFWSRYPRKAGKSEAAKSWVKATKAGADPDLLLAALKAHADYHQAAKTEQQYIPHASTWLNQKRYEDEPPSLPRSAGPQTAPRHMTEEEKKRALQF